MNFCQWCAGDPGDHHPDCPYGRAERAEAELEKRDQAGLACLAMMSRWGCADEPEARVLRDLTVDNIHRAAQAAARAAGEEVEEPPCLGLDSVEKDIIATRAARAAAKEEPTP